MSIAKPLITIVIPALNAADVIARCLQSLAVQTLRDFEVIVADGVSADETVEIAQRFSATVPALQVDLRADGGVYDAINRGLSLARGQWIYVLGSDDQIAGTEVFAIVARTLTATSAEIVYGDVVMGGANQWVADGARYAGEVGLAFLSKKNICQQSMFYRRSALLQDGGFDVRYRICADWAYLLNAYHRRPIQRVDLVICIYATGGLSSRGGDFQFGEDRDEILGRAFSRKPFDPELRAIRPAVRSSLFSAMRELAFVRTLLLTIAYARASINL